MADKRWSIPKGWQWSKAKDFSVIIAGGTPKHSTLKANYSSDGIPWLTPTDLSNYHESTISRGKRSLSIEGYANSSARLIPKGSVLFTSRAPIGYCVIAGNEISTNQGFKNFVPAGGINPHFLRYYLKNSKAYAESKASGTTFLELSGKKAGELSFPIAPLKEQNRIADKIEALVSRSEQAESALDAIPILLDQYRRSILAAAFRGNLTEDWRKKNRVKISSWKTVDLNSLGIWSGGGTPKKSQESYWKDGNVLWASPKDMKTDVIIDTKDKITNEAVLKSSTKYIDANSILMVTRSSVLQHTFPVAIAAKTLTVNQDLKALTISDGIEFKYVFYALKAFEKEILRNCAKDGTTVQSIETDKLKSFTIPLPIQDEQVEIANILDRWFEKVDIIMALYNDSKIKVLSLKQSILAKAFRGELVPQDPNDEPASVLLKRIGIERENLKKELKNNKKPIRNNTGSESKRMIIPVIDALKKSEGPLSAQQLLSAAGYPNNADTDQIEQFFLDIRKAIDDKQVKMWREDNQDYFKLAG